MKTIFITLLMVLTMAATGTATEDCSANDIIINGCNGIPDGNPYTYDYFQYISTYNQDTQTCSEPVSYWEKFVLNWCDFQCGAECQTDIDCGEGETCSEECGCVSDSHEVPEFTTIGAGLALIGSAFFYMKRRKKIEEESA